MNYKRIALFYVFIGIIIMLVAPKYSMDEHDSKGARERLKNIIYVMHDIKPLESVEVVNFGKIAYVKKDCSVFCKFKVTKDENMQISNFKRFFKQNDWNEKSASKDDIVYEKNGIMVRVYEDKTKRSILEKSCQRGFVLIVSDIRNILTKELYGNKEFLKGVI